MLIIGFMKKIRYEIIKIFFCCFSELQAKLTPGRATYQKIAASTPSTAHLRQLSKEVMYDK